MKVGKRSKFSGIQFPIFTLSTVPIVTYRQQDTFITVKNKTKWANSSKTQDNYIIKLFNNSDRVMFDYTCRNITELINSNSVWGIDNKNEIFNLSIKQQFKFASKAIIKQINKYIFCERISHPFIIPEPFIQQNLINYYCNCVYIDNSWILKNITVFRDENNTIIL